MGIMRKSASMIAIGLCALALASCNLKFFSGDPQKETPTPDTVTYNATLDRWEAYDSSNAMIWYEKRYAAGDLQVVEHYSAAGAAVWKTTDGNESIATGGNRHTFITYHPGSSSGTWSQYGKTVDDASIPVTSVESPSGGFTRSIHREYSALDLLLSYTVSDFDANGQETGVYDFSGTDQLLSARLFGNSTAHNPEGNRVLKAYYDADGALAAFQSMGYDAENRWSSVLPYGASSPSKLIQPVTAEISAAQLWAWPAGKAWATQGDRDLAPADSDNWISHIVLTVDEPTQALSVASAELRGYDASGNRTSVKSYAGASLAEMTRTTYNSSGDPLKRGNWLPVSGGSVTGTVAIELPGGPASKALSISNDLSIPNLALPTPPSSPVGSLELSDLAMQEKSYTLWVYDARGSPRVRFRRSRLPDEIRLHACRERRGLRGPGRSPGPAADLEHGLRRAEAPHKPEPDLERQGAVQARAAVQFLRPLEPTGRPGGARHRQRDPAPPPLHQGDLSQRLYAG